MPESIEPKRPGGTSRFFQSLYYDPFRWSLIKSFALFSLGIRIARECIGLDIMSPSPAVNYA